MNSVNSLLKSIVTLGLTSLVIGGTFAVAANPPPAPAAAKSTRVTDIWGPMRQSLAWDIALAPHRGAEKSDEQIIKTQQSVASAPDPRAHLERLGWLYVAKARESHDAGYYKLAEQCALALKVQEPNNAAGLLLLGHVAQSLHRFTDAERIARQLIAQREFAFDHGLLGDALVDQGKLSDAIVAYQQMVDMKPGLQSYSRVAHVRWLRGDLSGAIETATLATRVTQASDPESSAWAFTRLGVLQTQVGALEKATAALDAANARIPDYAAALLLRGRQLLAADKFSDAVDVLQRAAAQNPLPEYQWPLADALRVAGRESDAMAVEAELGRKGAASDPRTYALYLATRGEAVDVALRLATRELRERGDVFTHDAMAWALTAAGRNDDAWASMERALAEGTKDARLFLHASAIASRLGRVDAGEWLARARDLQGMLLPSERQHLAAVERVAVQSPGSSVPFSAQQ